MRPHLRYLKYVLLHKAYVFAAGVRINGIFTGPSQSPLRRLAWFWRLLVHDLSKFRPSEWRPYVAKFYGPQTLPLAGKDREVQAAFNRAWLLHIHRNEHHWQHWILHEDSGKTLVLLPEAVIADEMLADWIGAGTKILKLPTLDACIAETVAWYAANRTRIQLRELIRNRIEENLHGLALEAGLMQFAAEMESAKAARQSIMIPGR